MKNIKQYSIYATYQNQNIPELSDRISETPDLQWNNFPDQTYWKFLPLFRAKIFFSLSSKVMSWTKGKEISFL